MRAQATPILSQTGWRYVVSKPLIGVVRRGERWPVSGILSKRARVL